jgi:hypothetical protein
MEPSKHLVCAAALFGGLIATAAADDSPAATPYRPTISNPAELSAPGWLELEMGLNRQHTPSDRRQALPYTAKLALDEDWGILVGGEAYIHESGNEGNRNGFGDTSFILKRRFATADENLNFGIEAGLKLPTAHRRLGSGKADWGINGIVSYDFADSWRLDVNLGVTRLGARAAGEGLTSTLWAAAVSKSFGDWGLAVEHSGTHQRGVPNGRQWLIAASYAVSPRFVLDMGATRSRQDDETGHSLFFGFTWLANRLF